MIHLLSRNSGAAVRDALLREIDSDPVIREAAIAVTAEDGLVTLIGCVDTRGVKVAAERAAKRIPGVRTIANDLHVKGPRERSDTDITRDGIVGSMHQRLAAEGAVKHLPGVQGVNNDSTLAAPSRPLVEAPAEGSALWRS